jgi:DNA-binding Xre family transcriptional regulator
MITFERLWITMKQRGISQYKLIKDYNISSGQLDRLRKNQNVNTYTLNQLCNILECNLEDIAEYKKECDKNIQKEAEP